MLLDMYMCVLILTMLIMLSHYSFLPNQHMYPAEMPTRPPEGGGEYNNTIAQSQGGHLISTDAI